MTEGSMLLPMLRYALPIIFSNLLQLFYNSADMFVLGNFCRDENALGSVGCTSALINLILGLFIGLGAGVCVTLAQSIGSGDRERVVRTVHTSVLLSIILGVAVTVIGVLFTPKLLVLMKTPEEFLVGASLYVKIYFCGSVPNIMYNFLSGILRSRGDTVHPLIFSSVGGAVNIVFNLIFVIVFGMGVDGVAIATVISQLLSALLTLIYMSRLENDCRFVPSKLAIDKTVLKRLLRIGIPAGIQGTLFSLSNVLLQSSYNELGPLYVKANTAASNVDAYIHSILVSFYHVALTFSSQNYGAKNAERIKKVFFFSCGLECVLGIVLGVLSYIFAEPLVSIFDSNPDVVEAAKIRFLALGLPYFLSGLMDTGTAMLRSIGKSLMATVITFIGSCLLRIVWVYTIFAVYHNIFVLYLVYPVSWFLTFAALITAFFILLRRETKKWKECSA